MNIMIFDTETISAEREKAFCYDIGYVIYNTETDEVEHLDTILISEVFDNPILFSMAYYACNRPLYPEDAKHLTWFEAMDELIEVIKKYNVQHAYAYNSAFDADVFEMNSLFYDTVNPLNLVKVHDIWGYASEFLIDDMSYCNYCDNRGLYTKSQAFYSVTAEAVYNYLDNTDTKEKHIALDDALMEMEILRFCVRVARGNWNTDYPVIKFLPRKNYGKSYKVMVNGQCVWSGECKSVTKRDNGVFIRTSEA